MNPADYPIEKNVPLPPPPVEVRMAVWDQVVKTMAVGDSFLTKQDEDYREPLKAMEKCGFKGDVRASGKRFRVWRTA
jgi:hypothetical protein